LGPKGKGEGGVEPELVAPAVEGAVLLIGLDEEPAGRLVPAVAVSVCATVVVVAGTAAVAGAVDVVDVVGVAVGVLVAGGVVVAGATGTGVLAAGAAGAVAVGVEGLRVAVAL